MSQGASKIVYWYAKKHWPSGLPKELVATKKQVKLAAEKAVSELADGATRKGILIRLAGQSGSGKTTQLLPAAEKYSEKKGVKPVLIAARILSKYHPHYEEILAKYGEAEIRKRTDDFATVVMYLVVDELARQRCDMIIDMSFVSTKVENMLVRMTREYAEKMVLMMAVAPEITEKLLSGREWRHGEKLEKEFMVATEKALDFYGEKCPKMRMVMWGFDKKEPVYDGKMAGAAEAWQREVLRKDVKIRYNEAKLREAKIKYLTK